MKAVKRLLWWILVGSSGGLNRGRILNLILEKPCNANELSRVLKLDYKTVRHHLDVLQKNHLIISSVGDYGKVYFPSSMLEENIELFKEITDKIVKK
jgi:predicted transcriptional regulator